jgi:hypothetical protein
VAGSWIALDLLSLVIHRNCLQTLRPSMLNALFNLTPAASA